MKLIYKEKLGGLVDVGDLVRYDGIISLIAADYFSSDFPFQIISLESGRKLNAYGDSVSLTQRCELLIKSENLKIIVKNIAEGE